MSFFFFLKSISICLCRIFFSSIKHSYTNQLSSYSSIIATILLIAILNANIDFTHYNLDSKSLMTGDELLELEDRLDRCAQIAVDAKYNREFAALKKNPT
jgi:hypothetical protein